jgi:hypothetical protein
MSDVAAICAEFGIQIVPANVYPLPGQTRAVATLRRIMHRHGKGHLRLVVATLAETKGNQGLINEYSAWAVSDLIRACSDWVENRTEEWFSAWDEIPLGWVMWQCQELSGVIAQRQALAGMMYMLLCRHQRARMGNKEADYSYLRRAKQSDKARQAAA